MNQRQFKGVLKRQLRRQVPECSQDLCLRDKSRIWGSVSYLVCILLNNFALFPQTFTIPMISGAKGSKVYFHCFDFFTAADENENV